MRKRKAAAQAQRAQMEFAQSPVGLATAAHDRGDALLQIAMRVVDTNPPILSQIEAIGWRLEHAGYAFIVSSSSYTNVDGALAGLDVGGELAGVYLFPDAELYTATGDPVLAFRTRCDQIAAQRRHKIGRSGRPSVLYPRTSWRDERSVGARCGADTLRTATTRHR